jgi:hypothetical protein
VVAPSFLRRLSSAWLLVAGLMVSVFITTALVAALLSFYVTGLPAAVSHELAASGSLSISLSAEANGSAAGVTRLVTARMRAAFGTARYRQFAAVWSNDLALPGPHSAGHVPVLEAAAVTGLRQYADLVSGSWPGVPRAGDPIPVGLPASVAADLRLGVGSVLTLRYVGGSTPVSLRVTGLFRPLNAAATFWRLDEIGSAGVTVAGGFASYGPAVVSPAAFAAAPHHRALLQPAAVSFVIVPSAVSIRPASLDSLAARINAAAASLQQAGTSLVTTTMPQTLVNLAEGVAAAKSLVLISGLQLLLLAGAALALAGRLLASHRDEENALLAARGAGRWQLIGPSLAEGLLACAVAAAAGVLAGTWLAARMMSSLSGDQERHLTVAHQGWAGAAVLLVLCLCIVLWPALRPAGISAVRIRRGRQAAVASAAAAGADLALLALALVSLHELLSYSAAGRGAGVDPVIVAAPALALAGLSLIPLRLLPLAARGLERLTDRSRRLGTAMANWEVSRRPVRQSGPALLVVLAVGTSTLALAQYQSWQQSVRDQALFGAGAQVRVGLAGPQLLSGVTRITRLGGVTAAMPVSEPPVQSGQFLVIGARQAGATVRMRPDLSGGVATAQLWRTLGSGALPGIVVPGRPQRLELAASMAGGLAGRLGPAAAELIVQDAYGLAYTVPAGAMPADGRLHGLVAQLGPTAGIAYPLRIIGLSLTYDMPLAPASAAARAADASAVVSISSFAASATPGGPFGAPFAAGRLLARWLPQTSAPGLSQLSSVLAGHADKARQPSVLGWTTAGRVAQLTIAPGNGPALPPKTLAQLGITSLPADVLITIPPAAHPVPLVATNGYLHATGLRIGSAQLISVGGTAVLARLVRAVSAFPTVLSGSAIVADQAAVQDALVSAGGAPLPVTGWWLSTVSGAAPPGLPAGSGVVVAAATTRSLGRDAVSAAPMHAALAVAAAAAVLAAIGFCVSVTASAQSRRGQRALLAALGVPAGAQARLFCLEEIMISGPSALVGLALGIGLAHLLIPAITLTAVGGLPVPPVVVRLPVTWIALITLAVPAIPVLAAVIVTLRQPDPAAQLRAAEAAG